MIAAGSLDGEADIRHNRRLVGPLGSRHLSGLAFRPIPSRLLEHFAFVARARRARRQPSWRNAMTTRFVVGLAAVSLLLSGAARARAEYIITDLGSLGGRASDAAGINDAGQVVGESRTSTGQWHAYVYSNGIMIDINPAGSWMSNASAINASGQVVGNAQSSMSGYGFMYSNGKTTALSGLTSASGISASGQVAGIGYTLTATLYSGGKLTDLGTLGGYFSAPRGMNAAGQVVGYSYLPRADAVGAFLYSGGKMTNLGSLGGSFAEAFAVNASGQVIGHSLTADGNYHAFLYSGGKMTDLGTLGGKESSANGINNAGQIVGAAQTNINGATHAFVFIDGKITDLNSLIPPESRWFLTNASAINNLGQIVGTGRSPNGDYHAFLLTPTPAPEPTSLTLFGLGVLGLAGHAWRKRRRAGA
jgi:probable HAF family extracellular repeat protein